MLKPVLTKPLTRGSKAFYEANTFGKKMDLSKPIKQSSQVINFFEGVHRSLHHTKQGNYYVLNERGAQVWQTLSEPHRVDELFLKLCDKNQACSQDEVEGIKHLCNELFVQGFLEQK